MNRLGSLLRAQGRAGEDKSWYRRAVKAGDIRAMVNLGSLLKEQEKNSEAGLWFRRAIAEGGPTVVRQFGSLLNRRGMGERWAFAWWFVGTVFRRSR
ncbi:tetratricopeptide repeat protein [Nocardiopsis aegyptia]|uniref:TPR repeat protein n=1 Tax=Nocardiopsis aegyptia TaxID=220378 RepID=A0A7Z0EJ64_9ACTN|nr:tetratricopeptide repeat protein [Nocardiopsis aegyptia]NYJ32556.1 TPR repeat protein [Nocardiopsis aegyptia]